MTRKIYRLSNWSDYNMALQKRGSIEIWIDKNAISKWYVIPSKKKKRKAGRPQKYSDIAIKCALTVKFLYSLAFRQTEGFLTDFLKLLGLEIKTPDYTTVCKRQAEVEVEVIRRHKNCRKFFMLIDSSGFKIFGDGEWKVRQHGYSKRRTWIKLHLGVGITAGNKKRIEVAEVTKQDDHDCKVFPKLLRKVEGKIDKVIGDGAYDFKGCYAVATKVGTKLIAPPRKNAKIHCEKGKRPPPIFERNENISYVRRYGLERWKEKNNYHVRSLVENMFFRLKTTFDDRLAAHKFENQKIESLLKCQILNRMSEFGEAKSYVMN